MKAFEDPAEEIKRLRRCIGDLVSVVSLPAIWTGGEPSQIAHTLLDALSSMLHLDLAYVRWNDPAAETPSEVVRLAQGLGDVDGGRQIGEAIGRSLGDDAQEWPARIPDPTAEGMMSIVPLRLGLRGELGAFVAGSRRSDFPRETERLLLSVAANQASVGLQEARLRAEQKRFADDLDGRVAQRTLELARANEELRKEIAERRAVEERLRQEEKDLKQSEARKAAILESALDCIVTIDDQGRITEFNPAAERTFGCSRDQVLGQQLAQVMIPPSLQAQHRQGFARYLATGEPHVLGKRVEMTAKRADGGEFPVEIAITRIPLEGPPSVTAYLRDITARKRADEELRRSAAFLAEGQRLSLTGSFSWRVATEEILWSEELYRIFELGRGEPVTLALIRDRFHPDDRSLLADMIAGARNGDRGFDYEHRLLMPDRSVKYVHLVAHGNRGADGQLEYIGAIQDITERRLSEQALGKVRSELAHVARTTTLGVLTASIAHEVNQPLSGIITNAGTCLRMLAADPPDVVGASETARRTIRDGQRASQVILRLRALFAKKDATTEPIDLNEATREVIALTLSELRRNDVAVRLEAADGLPPITGDRVQLQQVILNLVLNAADAMSGVDDRPRQLSIRTELEESDRVRLSVRDTGVGFDPRSAELLFEAFYTTKGSGMGIGLSVSRSIIEHHRGRLWAAPNDGVGATFAFSIPTRSPDVAGGL